MLAISFPSIFAIWITSLRNCWCCGADNFPSLANTVNIGTHSRTEFNDVL